MLVRDNSLGEIKEFLDQDVLLLCLTRNWSPTNVLCLKLLLFLPSGSPHLTQIKLEGGEHQGLFFEQQE